MKSELAPVSVLIVLGLLLGSHSPLRGGDIAVDKKAEYVNKNDRIDNEDARGGAAERIEMIDDGGITLIQTQTYVPGKDTFKAFATFSTHVDIFLDPSGFCESRDKDGPTAIQFSGVFGIFTAGDYPLQGEGNILIARAGGKGPGKAEPPPEKHWSEKVDEAFGRVKEVSFGGDSYMPVGLDAMANGVAALKQYVAPHWLDGNDDGDASDPMSQPDTVVDRRFPISYNRKTRPAIESAVFILGEAPPAGSEIFVKGVGLDGIAFGGDDGVAAVLSGASTITIAGTKADNDRIVGSAPFSDTIMFYNPFSISWEVRIGPGGWKPLGTSDNRVYVRLGNPTLSDDEKPYFVETLLELACNSASGQGDANSAFGRVWGEYTDRVVKRKPLDGFNSPDGVQTCYWLERNDPRMREPKLPEYGALVKHLLDYRNTDNADATLDGVGTCTAWADLLRLSAQSIGIDGIETIEIKPVVPATTILVKNWTFPQAPNGPDAAFPYLALAPAPGIAAQGRDNPHSIFINHIVVWRGNKVFDPSYGLPGKRLGATPAQHEADALGGLVKRADANGPVVGARKPSGEFGNDLIYGVLGSDPPKVLDKDGRQVNE